MATDDEVAKIREIMWVVRSPTIVELGARVGEDEGWLRSCCREEAHYVMVEPDIRNCQAILDKPTTRTRRLILGAVADYTGTIEFFGSVTDGNTRGSGSIHRPTAHKEIFPKVEFPEELHVKVPCYTLDFIFDKEWLSKIDLLWVDIQGAEKQMILGGEKALSRTRFLFIETEDRELYEGMALKSELLKMLSGWRLVQDFGYNCLLFNTKFEDR